MFAYPSLDEPTSTSEPGVQAYKWDIILLT